VTTLGRPRGPALVTGARRFETGPAAPSEPDGLPDAAGPRPPACAETSDSRWRTQDRAWLCIGTRYRGPGQHREVAQRKYRRPARLGKKRCDAHRGMGCDGIWRGSDPGVGKPLHSDAKRGVRDQATPVRVGAFTRVGDLFPARASADNGMSGCCWSRTGGATSRDRNGLYRESVKGRMIVLFDQASCRTDIQAGTGVPPDA
jgi:hypothetical protein